ncbi:DMAC1 protein, partial [Bucco capensis]|nr:DMAC1 protein [Bucco capensis]
MLPPPATEQAPSRPQTPGTAPVPVRSALFGGCWSCRILSGTGLLLAALWIYQWPRRSMKLGIPPTMGTIAQITFAISE